MFISNTPTLLFIDGSMMQKYMTIGSQLIDYQKVQTFFSNHCVVQQSSFHLVEYRDDKGDSHPRHEFVTYLQHYGYKVKVKPMNVVKATNPETVNANRRFSVASDLIVNVMSSVRDSVIPIAQVILFIGDSDYITLVEDLRNQGIRVAIVSSLKVRDANADNRMRMLISDKLRRQANVFIELEEIYPEIAREMRDRPNNRVSANRVPKELPSIVDDEDDVG